MAAIDSAPTIGKPLTRVDGRLKVTGAATYAAEFQRPKLAYGALIQSAIANGRVTKIDISELWSPKLSSKPLTRLHLFESRIKRNRQSSIFRMNAPPTPQRLRKNSLAAKICRLNAAMSMA